MGITLSHGTTPPLHNLEFRQYSFAAAVSRPCNSCAGTVSIIVRPDHVVTRPAMGPTPPCPNAPPLCESLYTRDPPHHSSFSVARFSHLSDFQS